MSRLPVSERDVSDQPLSARTAAVRWHHIGADCGLVDKHQSCRSRNPCSRIQRRRALATSARCCSAARKLFFNSDVMACEEAPECGAAAVDSVFAHRRNDLIQRQIRLLSDESEYPLRMPLQRRNASSAWFWPRNALSLPVLSHLTAELALISNCSAASRRDAPASTSQSFVLALHRDTCRAWLTPQRRINAHRPAPNLALGNPPIYFGRKTL